MKIVILTPDTDIDRRIILQANSLIREGHEITIIGVPHSGDDKLSGHADPRIVIKRIDSQLIDYHSVAVKLYRSFHRKLMNFAYRRNDFLNLYANGNLKDGKNLLAKTNNVFVQFNVQLINKVTTMFIRLLQKMINLGYNSILRFMRTFNINFFPLFDRAFYNAAISEEMDLIVANDLPSLKAAYMVAKEKGVPLVYDAHENYTEQCTLPKKYARLLERIESEILPEVDFWIVPNEMLGQAMIEKYQSKYNKSVSEPLVIQNAVRHWVDYDEHSNTNVIREKLHLPQHIRIILFQGGFIPNRNLENLIKALKYVRHPDVVLVMLGFGSYVENLKSIVQKNKLQDRVYFMDAVPQEELLQYTCSADVGVIPYPAVDKNTYYCSPNKLYEFIQARLPILANDLPFLRRVIVGEGIGTVEDFSSPRSIASAIDSLFQDSGQILRFKKRLEEIVDIYNWEEEERKLISKYSKFKDLQSSVG